MAKRSSKKQPVVPRGPQGSAPQPVRPVSVPRNRQGASSRSRSASRPTVSPATRTTSVRLGDLERDHGPVSPRSAVKPKRSAAFKIAVSLVVALVLIAGTYGGLYVSGAFPIESIEVDGADHLTAEEMSVLAAVPQGSTLLNVDAAAIKNNVIRDAWVQDVKVHRSFPSTLVLDVTERQIAAVVEVVADNAKTTQQWAIAADGMWLMEIPDRSSELGQSINQTIYDDADKVLHIVDVPFGLTPEVGTYCTDGNVNNALAILDGLSTELADRIKTVSATDAQSTMLTLDNGVEIAFGTADDIREKERICLEIMEKNPDKVAYINVRVVDRPTWRAVQ